MPFLHHHNSTDEHLSRVLLFSVMLHYVVFFILFGNPFLLILSDGPEGNESDKHFEVQLLSQPGLGTTSGKVPVSKDDQSLGKGGLAGLGQFPPKVEALGLFPQEVSIEGSEAGTPEGRHSEQPGALPEPFEDDPTQMPDLKKELEHQTDGADDAKALALKRDGKALLLDEPPPLVTTKKPPPNMTGPEDCMIKVVGMVCPDGNAQCITAYKEFCASLPK